MRSVAAALTICLFLVGAGTLSASPSNDAAVLSSMRGMDVVVTKIEGVESITGMFGNSLSAEAGERLMVAVLELTSSSAGKMPLEIADFSAVFETEGGPSVSLSCAVGREDTWFMPPAAGNKMTVGWPVEKGKQEIKVVFSVPREAEDFIVRYPVSAERRTMVKTGPAANATGSAKPPEKLSEPAMVERIRKDPNYTPLVIEDIQPAKESYKARAFIPGDVRVGESFRFLLMFAEGRTDFPAGDGAIHEIGGSFEFPVREEVFRFESDEADSLVFAMLEGIGYAYLKGKGTVIFPDGRKVRLGE